MSDENWLPSDLPPDLMTWEVHASDLGAVVLVRGDESYVFTTDSRGFTFEIQAYAQGFLTRTWHRAFGRDEPWVVVDLG